MIIYLSILNSIIYKRIEKIICNDLYNIIYIKMMNTQSNDDLTVFP